MYIIAEQPCPEVCMRCRVDQECYACKAMSKVIGVWLVEGLCMYVLCQSEWGPWGGLSPASPRPTLETLAGVTISFDIVTETRGPGPVLGGATPHRRRLCLPQWPQRRHSTFSIQHHPLARRRQQCEHGHAHHTALLQRVDSVSVRSLHPC